MTSRRERFRNGRHAALAMRAQMAPGIGEKSIPAFQGTKIIRLARVLSFGNRGKPAEKHAANGIGVTSVV